LPFKRAAIQQCRHLIGLNQKPRGNSGILSIPHFFTAAAIWEIAELKLGFPSTLTRSSRQSFSNSQT
jgi:hypothetical protein